MKPLYVLIVLVMLVCASVSFSQTNYYVDPQAGNDIWDGLSPTYTSGLNGPKGTLQETVNAASPNDVLHMTGAMYNESVVIGKNLTVCCMGASLLQNLSITNNALLTLNNSIQITGSLTLIGGVITVDWDHMIQISNTSPSAVVITGGRIIGRVNRTIGANTTEPYVLTDANTVIVPDGNQSQPVDIYVQSVPELPPHITPGQNAINRYYYFWTGGGTIGGTIRIAYLETELNGISEQNLTAFRWGNGDTHWAEWAGTVNATENYVEVAGAVIGDWAKWTLGDATGPLPIQLASFNAIVTNGNNIALDWRTLTETNNYGFYVQRRSPGSEAYADVANSFVQGHGTTIDPQSYAWTHQGVLPGTYTYRLKQVDLDGTIHFSDGRQVIVSSPTGVTESHVPAAFVLAQNYPNPFNPSTQIQFTVDAAAYTSLTVFDILGKEVGTLYAGLAEPGKLYSVNFDASAITNGTYFYKLVNGNQTSMKKMMLLK